MTGPRLSEQELQRLWHEYQATQRVAPAPRTPSESTGTRATNRNATPAQVAANRADDVALLEGIGRSAAQGVTLGNYDELAAGVKTGFGFGGDYRKERDAIRAADAAFSDAHPYIAAGANLVGGVASGAGMARLAAAVPALTTLGLAPRASAGATAMQRVGQAAKMGGAAGVVAGVGAAPEARDVPTYAPAYGLGGAALGTLLGTGAEFLRGTRNMVAQVGATPGEQGTVRKALQAETPEQAGARRVLGVLGRTGTSLDALAAKTATAERPTALAELIPEDQGVRSLRIMRNVGRRGGVIDRSLAERAADEPARYAESIARNTGVPEGLDAATVADKAKQAVATRVDALYQQSYQNPDVSAKPVLKAVEKLAGLKRGREALERAKELSTGFDALQSIDPNTPTISVQNLHNLRQGVDYALDRAVQDGDAQMVRILSAERATVDRAFKAAGGKLARRADRLWESASAQGESFALGERSQLAQTKGAMVRLKGEARDPEAFRQGAASKQLARVESVSDGVAGQTRNPVVSTMGSPTARARSSLGYRSADEFAKTRGDADAIVRRLQTRNAVSGNSATARNQAEMIDEFMADPNAVAGAVVNPTAMPRLMVERVLRGGAQGLNAAQADEAARILAAGLPGQMSLAEATAKLRLFEPMIRQQLERSLLRQSGAIRGGLAAISGPDR